MPHCFSLSTEFPGMGTEDGRTQWVQAGFQAAGLAATLVIALVGGAITGMPYNHRELSK